VEVLAADITPFELNVDFDSLLILVHDNAGEVATQLQSSFPVRPVSSLAPPHRDTTSEGLTVWKAPIDGGVLPGKHSVLDSARHRSICI
jgi:hypothetical protein